MVNMEPRARIKNMPVLRKGVKRNPALDEVRLGTRLILAYSAEDNAFVGTVQNTTDETLQQVRGEVHLSNGVELGPTTPQDLETGRTVEVVLGAADQEFDGWSPRAEVGGSEHGHEGEGGSEYGSGGEG